MPPSIWDHTSREKFEDNVLALHHAAPSQQVDLNRQHMHHRPSNDDLYLLAPGTERQLSKDFAFLAAWSDLPECVAAATVQQDISRPGLFINVAANGGIHGTVKSGIENICGLLMQRANHVITEDVCFEQCLTIVTDFHAQRILQRLGCAKSRSPTKRLGPEPVSLSARLAILIQDLKGRKAVQSLGHRKAMLKRMNRLLVMMRACEHATADCDASAVKNLVVASYLLSVDGVSLIESLKTLGADANTLERKEVRHIGAFANYYRICLYFSRAAQSYRAVFRHIEVVIIPEYKCEKWRGRKHYVHAEIQLLVYHEMQSRPASPRFIGTSKRACFLCYTFMTAHGRHLVSDTHGEVHPQWTVPDRADYTKQVRKCLDASLVRCAALISTALQRSRSLKRRGPLVQSLLDLALDKLRTPSVSTLAPSLGGTKPSAPQGKRVLPMTRGREGVAAKKSLEDNAVGFEAKRNEYLYDRKRLLVAAGGCRRIAINTLDIYLALEAGELGYRMGSCEVSHTAASPDFAGKVVHVSDLPVETDVTFSVTDPEGGYSIALKDVPGNSNKLVLRWHENSM